jgi:hypothetical protein
MYIANRENVSLPTLFLSSYHEAYININRFERGIKSKKT